MGKKFLAIGCLLAGLGIILGAMGAHALKPHLEPNQLTSFETGVRYHLYHALALLFVGLFQERYVDKTLSLVGYLFILGTFCFSGSIYLLACKNLLHIEQYTSILGPITPVGGIFFIAGWALLFILILKVRK